MQREQHVETWSGVGRLTQDGKEIATNVRYRIEVFKTFHYVRGMGDGATERVAGTGRLAFRIESSLDTDRLTPASVTLELEDGRSVDVFHDGNRWVNSSQMRDPG